jgi:membrane protein implicated in regulation of membrane protease activity
LQGIGTRIEVMAGLYPRAYLLLTTILALTGFACLALFPLLVVAGVAGIYHALINVPDIAWSQLLVWALVTVFCALVTYRIARFRPTLPAGVLLERKQAPDLFGLVEDTGEQYGRTGVDRIVITGGYQLDIIKTPCTALPVWSTRSLVIGLPLMQSLSSQQFSCLLARRLGQFSKRSNLLLNWLFELRDIWPGYRTADVRTDPGFLPVHLLFSVYAPLYRVVSTAAARFDELQADSYAMELCGDEEVLETITTDAVHRLFLREKYWPAIRKLGVRQAAAITRTNSGIITVLRAGLQEGKIEEWIGKAMSMEQQWNDLNPLLTQRLDNIGHAHARMQAHAGESAAEDYLPASGHPIKAALENIPSSGYSQAQPWSVRMAGLKRRLQSVIHSLHAGEVNQG